MKAANADGKFVGSMAQNYAQPPAVAGAYHDVVTKFFHGEIKSSDSAVAELIKEASHANVNLFLTGGAMRDMLGGFQVRDLDFTVEGNALKLARAVATRTDARVLETDDNKKSMELLFPNGVRAEISMVTMPPGDSTSPRWGGR